MESWGRGCFWRKSGNRRRLGQRSCADKCVPKYNLGTRANFCRIHGSLRVTPAMEVGVADHVWSLREVVALLDSSKMVENAIPHPAHAPSLGKRLLIWFGIYFGLQLPLIGLLPFFWLFPVGLAYRFFPPLYLRDGPSQLAQLTAYGFYAVHLALSLVVKNRWAFWILVLSLLVVVSLNLSTCMEETRGIGQIKG